ncbi:CBO0543 family protein [Radiobacillus deserti]|uniref:Uncharacterized protein n=1 Tax=Radiobacillus deserti TaxID=2594883 RepID=A0A516KDZ2_9BACI|nr:CBO0543 family protein [Radiobacillus deserti]QDP39621.1 hypothetical protein FN924_05170 [Radiobacillus deserti]
MFILLITIVIFNLIAFLVPKRISHIELITTTLFALYLQLFTDVFLILKYNLYGYFGEGVDWKSTLYILGIYPPINFLFLNFFPYKKKHYYKMMYILAWGVLAIGFEAIFLWSGTFYYNEWKIWYSGILYPLLYILLVVFHRFTYHYLIVFKHLDSKNNH